MPTETTRPVPPDVDLIHRIRLAAGVTVPAAVAAVKAAGHKLSEVRWMQLESDRESRSGVVSRPNAKPVTIALMAWEVDRVAGSAVITPERLATEGDNPAAAALLAEMLTQDAARTPVPAPATAESPFSALEDPVGFISREETVRARPYADAIQERRIALALRGIAEPTGAQLFGPGDDADDWDRLGRRGFWEIRHRVWFVAAMQARQAAAHERESGTGTG